MISAERILKVVILAAVFALSARGLACLDITPVPQQTVDAASADGSGDGGSADGSADGGADGSPVDTGQAADGASLDAPVG